MDNGDMMPETMAICRYLAREHGKLYKILQYLLFLDIIRINDFVFEKYTG